MAGFRALGRRRVASSSFLDVERLHLIGPDGGAGLVRTLVTHPGAVAVLPVIGDDIVLLRQYRSAIDGSILEVPAGKLDVSGEPLEDTARRELREETGYEAGTLRPLVSLFTTPGFSDEVIHLFVADDLTEVEATPHGAEEEAAEVVRIPLEEARALLLAGALEDAKTIVAISLFLLER